MSIPSSTTTTTTTIKLSRQLRAAGIYDRDLAHELATASTAADAERAINGVSWTARDHAWAALYAVRGADLPGELWVWRDDQCCEPIAGSHDWDADDASAHGADDGDCYESPWTKQGTEISYEITRDRVTSTGVERERVPMTYVTTGELYESE